MAFPRGRWKENSEYFLHKMIVLPYWGFRAQVAFIVGTILGMITSSSILFSLIGDKDIRLWILGVLACFIITFAGGPLSRSLVAAFLSMMNFYEIAWVVVNTREEVCHVFYIGRRTNLDPDKVLANYLTQYSTEQIEKQTKYFDRRYDGGLILMD